MNCHQNSDLRVLRPGHGLFEFRPGTPLGKSVVLLQEPLNPASPERSPLLGHYMGMILSKCYTQTGGEMSCVTCHEPHVEPSGEEKAAYFRSKCLHCHSGESCKLAVSLRRAGKPPDDCAGCHMHKQGVNIVPHTALTDHRIVTPQGEPYPDSAFHLTTASLPDLIDLDAIPGDTDEPLPPETLLAAYVQAVNKDPVAYRDRYLAVLDQLAKSEPDNLLVLSELAQRELWKGKPGSPAKATQYLQRAVELHSNNAADYLRLSVLLGATNRMAESVRILQQGLLLSPYNRLFYEFLAARCLSMQQNENAARVARQGLQLFPEDATLRGMLAKANAAATSP